MMNGRRKARKREDLARSRYDFQLRATIYHAVARRNGHPPYLLVLSLALKLNG